MIQYPLVVVLLLLSTLASSHIRCGAAAAAAAAMDGSYVAVVSTALRGASTVIDVAIDGGGHLHYITSTGILYHVLPTGGDSHRSLRLGF